MYKQHGRFVLLFLATLVRDLLHVLPVLILPVPIYHLAVAAERGFWSFRAGFRFSAFRFFCARPGMNGVVL